MDRRSSGRQGNSVLTCPACGQAMQVPEQSQARRWQCPTCAAIFSAEPRPAEPEVPVVRRTSAPAPRSSRSLESIREAGSRPRESAGPSPLTLLVIGLVGLFVVIVTAIVIGLLVNIPQGRGGNVWQAEIPKKGPAEPQRGLRDNAVLDPEILDRTKRATVYIRVEMGRESATGTGFVVRREGRSAWIITNQHVVEPSEDGPGRPDWHGRGILPPFRMRPRWLDQPRLTVVFDSGTDRERSGIAQVVSQSAEPDLALLRVDNIEDVPEPLSVKAPQLRETERVFFFGFPFGADLALGRRNPAVTVHQGSITSLRRDARGVLRAVQVEADLNPGNSGGPAINAQGELVGIAVAIVVDTNIGLLIHPSELTAVLQPRFEPAQITLRTTNDRTEIIATASVFDPENSVREVFLLHRHQRASQPLPQAGNAVGGWEPLEPSVRTPLKLVAGRLQAIIPVQELGDDDAIACQTGFAFTTGRSNYSKPLLVRPPLAHREKPPAGLPPAGKPGSDAAGAAPRPGPANRFQQPARTIGTIASPEDWPGLLAYWPCDDGDGDTAQDASGHDRAARLRGHRWVEGVRGGGIELDGTDGHLDFGSDPIFNFKGSAPFTFAGWVRTTARGGTFLSLRSKENGTPVIGLHLENGGWLVAEMRDDLGSEMRPAVEFRAGKIADGQWHHLLLSRSESGGFSVYLNGRLAGRGEPRPFGRGVLNTCDGAISTNLRAFGIDLRHQMQRRPGRENALAGQIDECCVFARELTEAEIRQLAGLE